MATKNKKGFTLAEVLITLGIIGVVAAMTIPTLINNYQTKSWNTAAKVFEAKFTESLKTMNVQGQLGKYGKYNTTEGFVEELQKHFKITHVCDKDHTMQCFEKTVTWGDKDADLSNIKESKDFVEVAAGESDWGTNVMGVQFANGVTGLIAYNPKCTSDPHNNQVTGSDCYALLYDTSGFSDPNELGKDLRSTPNVKNLAGGGCAFEVGGTCYTTQPFTPTPITQTECLANKDKWGLADCPYDNDYFAGAVKQCGGLNKLPSPQQLAGITNYVFNTTTFGADTSDSGTLDIDKVESLGFTLNSIKTVYILSNQIDEESSNNQVYYRVLFDTGTYIAPYPREYESSTVVCVK